jgi:FkbM family methyltransferase
VDPLAAQWVSGQKLPEKFKFTQIGLSNFNGEQIFYQPYRKGKINKSAVQKTNQPSSLPVKRLVALMKERDHFYLDILKMDVEGLEFDVIRDISFIPMRQLLLEFHSRFFRFGILRLALARFRLWRMGFRLAHRDATDYTFVRKSPLFTNGPRWNREN